jgi:hypothetical protein
MHQERGYDVHREPYVEVINLTAPSCLSSSRESPSPWLCFARSPPTRHHAAFPLDLREQHRRRSMEQTPTTKRTSIQQHRRKKRTPRFNSVSKIDRASRVVFPLSFLAINLFYWYSYLSRSERIRHS